MKFSIIIPIYKVEKYLHECVDSVLSQSFTDFEVILVDDGSPDNCPKICDEYASKDSRIRVIHQKNAGIACARNAGVSVAEGEYILCVDSDDYLSSDNVLAELSELISDEPDVVLLGFKKYFESNRSYGEEVLPSICNTTTFEGMIRSELDENKYRGAAWTKLVKAELVKKNGISFRPGMVSFEDSDWFLNVMLNARTYTGYQSAVITYRQRPDSISHSPKTKSLIDALYVLETWSERIMSILPTDPSKKSLLNVMAYYFANHLVLYSGYPQKVSAPYKKRFKAQSYLLDYAVTPRALTVKKFYKLLGFDITILLLRILAKLKTRK